MSDTGDLGRRKPGILSKFTASAENNLTDVERELRNRSYHYQKSARFDASAGAVSRYNALSDAIAADISLLIGFQATARGVRDKDRIRQQAVPVFQNVSPQQRAEALEKVRANEVLVVQICSSSAERADRYRRHIEGLVIEVPESEAVQAERNLTNYEQLIGQVCLAPAGLPAESPVTVQPEGHPLIIKR